VAALTLGGLFGDVIVYHLGARIGQGLVRPRWLWVPRVDPERLEQMKRLLDRHGFKVLFIARFLVGLRFPVYLAVGASKMSFRRFFIIDAACASLVCGSFFALSYFLSERYGDVIYRWIRTGEFLVTLTVVASLVAALLIVRWRRRRAQRTASPRS
jgi:membrane protein DedA with SNARE-associated domain